MNQPRPDIDPRPIPEIVLQPEPAQPQPVDPVPPQPQEVPTPDQPVEDPLPPGQPELPPGPGNEPTPHSHPNEQIAYFMSGEVDFYLDGEPVRLRAGGMLVVPPGAMHYAVVVGDEPVMNLDIFTPSRPEYVA